MYILNTCEFNGNAKSERMKTLNPFFSLRSANACSMCVVLYFHFNRAIPCTSFTFHCRNGKKNERNARAHTRTNDALMPRWLNIDYGFGDICASVQILYGKYAPIQSMIQCDISRAHDSSRRFSLGHYSIRLLNY